MVKCGKCGERHGSVAAVKACHEGNLFPCHWWVEDWNEDGRFERDCGAEAVASARGWACAAGHEHVNMETRHAEQWDYAEEYGEAKDLALAGVEPRTMAGHVVLGPQSFAPA